MADKVHNGRAIVTDLESQRPDVLSRFHASPDRILWYYEANLALAEERSVPDALLVPLRDAVARLRELLSRRLTGLSGTENRDHSRRPAPQLRSVDEAHHRLRPDRPERTEGQERIAPLGAVDGDLAGEQVGERRVTGRVPSVRIASRAADDSDGAAPSRHRRRADGWCARSRPPRAAVTRRTPAASASNVAMPSGAATV